MATDKIKIGKKTWFVRVSEDNDKEYKYECHINPLVTHRLTFKLSEKETFNFIVGRAETCKLGKPPAMLYNLPKYTVSKLRSDFRERIKKQTKLSEEDFISSRFEILDI